MKKVILFLLLVSGISLNAQSYQKSNFYGGYSESCYDISFQKKHLLTDLTQRYVYMPMLKLGYSHFFAPRFAYNIELGIGNRYKSLTTRYSIFTMSLFELNLGFEYKFVKKIHFESYVIISPSIIPLTIACGYSSSDTSLMLSPFRRYYPVGGKIQLGFDYKFKNSVFVGFNCSYAEYYSSWMGLLYFSQAGLRFGFNF